MNEPEETARCLGRDEARLDFVDNRYLTTPTAHITRLLGDEALQPYLDAYSAQYRRLIQAVRNTH